MVHLVSFGLEEILIPVVIKELAGEAGKAYRYAPLVRDFVLRLVAGGKCEHCREYADVYV